VVRTIAIAAAGLVAGALLTASPAQAELPVRPGLSPVQSLGSDPRSEVQELLRQISELDDSWDGLTPAQRNQRIAGLQQQVTRVQQDVQSLPPDQRPEVQAMLGTAVIRLADILRKEQTPPTSACIFPFCLPGL
jgi:hypothetical protein